VDVRFRLVDHFFLKLSGADISKKIKILKKIVRMNLTAGLVMDVCGVTLRLTLRKL